MGTISLYQAQNCPITPRETVANGSAGPDAQLLVMTSFQRVSKRGYGEFISCESRQAQPEETNGPLLHDRGA